MPIVEYYPDKNKYAGTRVRHLTAMGIFFGEVKASMGDLRLVVWEGKNPSWVSKNALSACRLVEFSDPTKVPYK